MISFGFSEIWEVFLGLWWPFVRFMALIMSAPILSSRAMPIRVKILLGFLLASTTSPLISAPAPNSDFLLLLLQNILVGVILGFSLRLIFAAIEFAGDIAGLQIGLGFALLIDPMSSRQTPLIGNFFGVLASLVFLAINGHLMLIIQLVESFKVIPLNGEGLQLINFSVIVSWGGELFKIALLLSLPVVVVLLIVNISLGIMARIAPQLSIFSVGFSLSLVVGLLVLWVSLPYFAAPFERYLSTPLWVNS
jgi:flagellar biosynthetic protein FliR